MPVEPAVHAIQETAVRYACFEQRGGAARAVVWAHNFHLGDAPRLERAIGVVYHPESERASHYFRARLPQQFDAVLHIDTTSALSPLERWSYEEADLPETYPVGV